MDFGGQNQDESNHRLATGHFAGFIQIVPDRDASQEALRQVEEVTDSEPTNGEELLGSEELRRKFREGEQRLKARLSKPSGEKPVE